MSSRVDTDETPYARINGGDPYQEDESTMGFTIAGIIREPDARLVASAPELLAALKSLVAGVHGIHIDELPLDQRVSFGLVPICEAARAAIAKAEGRV